MERRASSPVLHPASLPIMTQADYLALKPGDTVRSLATRQVYIVEELQGAPTNRVVHFRTWTPPHELDANLRNPPTTRVVLPADAIERVYAPPAGAPDVRSQAN